MLWTKQEVDLLKEEYLNKGENYLSQVIKRSPNSVRIKASRLGISKLKQRENIKLTDVEEQVILGGLLGDLYCRIRSWSTNAIIEGAHCKKQEPYLYWKISILRSISFNLRRTKKGYLFFESRSYPCLSYYQKLFYEKGKKSVSMEILEKINGLGLAIWYMDDGYYYIKRRRISRLYTNGFSYEENLIIKEWFEKRWNIFPRIDIAKKPKEYPGKVWYYLSFGVKETEKLFELIKDYIHPSMEYKIGVNN